MRTGRVKPVHEKRLYGLPAGQSGLPRRAWLRWVSLWTAACFVSGPGCARWKPDKESETKTPLAAPRQTPDSVVLEATLLRYPEEQAAEFQSIWQVVDESSLALETRRALALNGIRCGVLMGEMPQVIRERMKELNQPNIYGSLEKLGMAADVSSDTMRLHCHANRRKDLPLRVGIADSVTVLHMDSGEMNGATYSQPAMLMDLRAIPLSDGRASIKLTPEIEHGEQQRRIVTSNIGLRTEMRREQRRWDNLAIEATLAPGQYFLCTVTEPPLGLGQAMFSTRTNERTTERVLLIIRMASTGLDGLFAPEDVETARLAAERS